ncbi:MAG: hypothetical protein QME76_07290 [Bacillota bacterium]|nr:hypothetical protein [Bacillota bacterium]
MSEARQETAASDERPRVVSDEFFFLLQRTDRLEEKLEQRIDQVEAKLNQRIDQVEVKLSQRIDQVEAKISGRIDRLDEKLSGTLRWGIGLVLTTLGLILAVAVKVWV